MNRQEKNILDKLNEQTNEIDVPEKLKPENIEKLLEGKKQKKWRPVYTYSAIAACAALVIGGVVWSQSGGFDKGKTGGGEHLEIRQTASAMTNAKGYEDVYETIKEWNASRQMVIEDSKDMAKAGKSDASAAAYGNMETQESGTFSETNVRQEGVLEADTVKTDGTYIYTLKESAREIGIIGSNGSEMKVEHVLTLDGGAQIAEFYVQDKKLTVLYNFYPEVSEGQMLGENTTAVTYDISDAANPKELGRVTQSGRYQSSRMVGDYIYILSDYYVQEDISKDDPATYVPEVSNKAVAYDRIYLPPGGSANQYTIITSVKFSNPNETVDHKALLTKGGMSYVSTENIYMCDMVYEQNESKTVVRKVEYKDGKLEAKGQAEVPGMLKDSFSIDEYEGTLRMVTTLNKRQIALLRGDSVLPEVSTEPVNALYTLNTDMEIIGKIEDIAKGEEVKSARFMGDVGYFVTFKNIDPLFSVDLKNPAEPKIIGELKIPGFSEYLHPYKEGLLLGIGIEMDEEGQVMEGVKLSMFDISDPANVKEVHKYVMEKTYNSSILYDYKAIMLDLENSMVGISVDGDTEQYCIFTYDEADGFTKTFSHDMAMGSYMTTRGIYMEDRLYLVKGNTIQLFDRNGYKKLDDLIF